MHLSWGYETDLSPQMEDPIKIKNSPITL